MRFNFPSPFVRWTVAVIFLAALLSRGAAAQSGEDADRADLYIDCDGIHSTRVTLTLSSPPDHTTGLTDALKRTLGGTLHHVRMTTRFDRWRLDADSEDALRPRGLMTSGTFDPAPLTDWLRGQQYPWLAVYVSHPKVPVVESAPPALEQYAQSNKIVDYYALRLTTADIGSLHYTISAGYRPPDVAAILLIMLVPLLSAVMLTYLGRQSVLRDRKAAPEAAWFGFLRFSRLVTLGMWLAWCSLYFAARASVLISFLTGTVSEQRRTGCEAIAILLPPMLTHLICIGLAYPVYARLREIEWTRADLLRQGFWLLSSRVVSMGLLSMSFGAAMDSEPRRAAAWIAGAIFSLIFCITQYIRAVAYQPHAVSVGELRDAIFDLAGRAKVTIKQIYVLPAGKGRLANAFAMQGDSILLTDYLLRNMSRREVDAILGHELTHLKHKHPIRLQQVLLLTIGLLVMTLVLVTAFNNLDPDVALTYFPLTILFGLLAFNFASRLFERVADKGAAALTGDPEAAITGLIKLSSLNRMPVSWGRMAEGMLTHPSTLRRIHAIAKHGGIAPERVQELLAHQDDDPDRYALPADLDEHRLFSTTFKTQRLSRLTMLLYAAILLPAPVAAWLAQMFALTGPALWFVWLVGLAATVTAFLVALDTGAAAGYNKLESQLRDRLETKGIPVIQERGIFVQFSPGGEPRLYEGHACWDIGFLFLTPESLVYVGEQTRFALRRDQITDARLIKGFPGWLPAPAIRIDWHAGESAPRDCFQLRNVERSMRQTARATRTLHAKIQEWREAGAAGAAGERFADLAPPAPATITSAPPPGGPGILVAGLITLLFLAFGVSLLLGLSFDFPSGGGLYVLGTAAFMALFQSLPFVVPRPRSVAAPPSSDAGSSPKTP